MLKESSQDTIGRRHPVVVVAAFVGLFGLSAFGPLVPVLVVAALSVWAAALDRRTMRIPNRLVVLGALVVVVGAVALISFGHGSAADLLMAIATGLLFGGAPMLFIVWLVRPALVGGGDWKLLAMQGAALGLLAPVAAGLVLITAAPIAAVQRLVGGRRIVPLGPGLAAGFAMSVLAALAFPYAFGDFT